VNFFILFYVYNYYHNIHIALFVKYEFPEANFETMVDTIFRQSAPRSGDPVCLAHTPAGFVLLHSIMKKRMAFSGPCAVIIL